MANGERSVTLTPKSLIPIGVAVAALVLAIPTAWNFGVRWGELNSDVRRLQQDLDSHKDENKEEHDVFDVRLRHLEGDRDERSRMQGRALPGEGTGHGADRALVDRGGALLRRTARAVDRPARHIQQRRGGSDPPDHDLSDD